jgi:glycosidase
MKHFHNLLLPLVIFLTLPLQILAQEFSIHKIEPPNWWTGMKLNEIQLMVYGDNLNNIKVIFEEGGPAVKKIYRLKNNSYLFIDIELPQNLPPKDYLITFTRNGKKLEVKYPIRQRELSKNKHQGFDKKDVLYLITPDRFVNGDKQNDNVTGFRDSLNRAHIIGRHGGDLQGIINKLDYLKDLGVTAIWCTPLVENNTSISYHGYSATNHYSIDPRFGSNKLYKTLVDEAHSRGLKVIFDHVSNHVSIDHPWVKNPPMDDWFNGSVDNHLTIMHDKMSYADLYSDSSTVLSLSKGWFASYLPDLNQSNAYVGNYIIQNTIWWIEFSGIDGIREDTYPYADQKFLSEWAATIFNEYPSLNIVGEVWTGEPAFLAYYQSGSFFPREFDSNLPSVTDFGVRDVLADYASGKANLYNIYETFAQDFIYPYPEKLVVFVDNHDIVRLMYLAKGNLNKAKNVLTMLLTTRGIPQLLYGTEIGMIGDEDHGLIRSDFPGGFPGDERNAFAPEGRTERENEIFSFVRELLHLRMNNRPLSEGSMIHFPPKENFYIYFRIFNSEKMMIVINDNETDMELNLSNYKSILKDAAKLVDARSGEEYPADIHSSLIVKGNESLLLIVD